MLERKIEMAVKLRQFANQIESMSEDDFKRYLNVHDVFARDIDVLSMSDYIDGSLNAMDTILGQEDAAITLLVTIDNIDPDEYENREKYSIIGVRK